MWGGSQLSFPRGQIHLGITGTCRSKNDLGGSGSSHSSVEGGPRGSERNLIEAFLAFIPSAKYRLQISDLIIDRLSSPRRVLAFPHSHPLESPTHIAAFDIHAGFCSFSPPFQYLTIYQLCKVFAMAAVLHCTFATSIYTE